LIQNDFQPAEQGQDGEWSAGMVNSSIFLTKNVIQKSFFTSFLTRSSATFPITLLSRSNFGDVSVPEIFRGIWKKA